MLVWDYVKSNTFCWYHLIIFVLVLSLAIFLLEKMTNKTADLTSYIESTYGVEVKKIDYSVQRARNNYHLFVIDTTYIVAYKRENQQEVFRVIINKEELKKFNEERSREENWIELENTLQ
uniref:Uncharacterized protein n=1 Tax=Listeria ivanovii TaxID=1638 RepID=A0A7T0Q8K3_LISIV|nr:hypothetical protein pLIS600326c [Listeria ivanovii]UCK61631.1 hypothetical protein pLIS46_00306c [Listeria ivanovii]